MKTNKSGYFRVDLKDIVIDGPIEDVKFYEDDNSIVLTIKLSGDMPEWAKEVAEICKQRGICAIALSRPMNYATFKKKEYYVINVRIMLSSDKFRVCEWDGKTKIAFDGAAELVKIFKKAKKVRALLWKPTVPDIKGRAPQKVYYCSSMLNVE